MTSLVAQGDPLSPDAVAKYKNGMVMFCLTHSKVHANETDYQNHLAANAGCVMIYAQKQS